MNPIVSLMSGGINSTVAAMRALNGAPPHFLHLDYGQCAAEQERAACEKIANALAGTLHVIQLPPWDAQGSANRVNGAESNPARRATSKAKPADRDRRPRGVLLTLIGLAQRLAGQVHSTEIISGISQVCDETDRKVDPGQGDPESQFAFLHAAGVALQLSQPARNRCFLDAPFIESPRVDIVRLGLRLGAPLHLTWSCLRNGEKPCGACMGCQARDSAFRECGVDDPALSLQKA